MRAVLIAKDVTIGAGLTLSSGASTTPDITNLTAGAVCLSTPNGLLYGAGGVGLLTADVDPVVFHIGGTVISKSSSIDRDMVSYAQIAYKAPTTKVMNFGNNVAGGATYELNLPSAIETGMEFGMIVVDTDDVKSRNQHKETIMVIAEDSDTFTTMLAKFITKVNAVSKLVTATAMVTSVTTGIKLTGAVLAQPFSAVPFGAFKDADVTEYKKLNGVYNAGLTNAAQVVAHGRGSGTYAQVLELELMGNAEDGRLDTYSAGQKIWSEASKVVPAETYDLHVITWRDMRDGTTSMKTNYENKLTIAVPAGSGNSAALATLLGGL